MALIDDVKTYLDITWSDQHTDAKLTGILARAQARLGEYAGCSVQELNLSSESSEKQLLLDLCRYIYNNASEDFEENYRADLLMLRASHAVEVTDDDETEEDVESADIGGAG